MIARRSHRLKSQDRHGGRHFKRLTSAIFAIVARRILPEWLWEPVNHRGRFKGCNGPHCVSHHLNTFADDFLMGAIYPFGEA